MNDSTPLHPESDVNMQDDERQNNGTAPLPEADDYPVLTEILPLLPDLSNTAQNEAAWNELEQRLSGKIMQRVEERIRFVLEEIIRQHLATSLRDMTGKLVSEVSKDLQSTLEVVVTHAVTDELHRLKQKEFFSGNNHLKITENTEPVPSGTQTVSQRGEL